ncbi:MAG TPA: hypothetical protein VF142_16050 [Longimicrobium sp.]
MIHAPSTLSRRAAAWLPDPRFAARLAGRALLVWLAMRAVLAVFLTLLGLDPVSLVPAAALVVVGAVAVAVALDARRREGLFMANLGTPAAWTPAVGAAVAAVLETGAGLAVRGG